MLTPGLTRSHDVQLAALGGCFNLSNGGHLRLLKVAADPSANDDVIEICFNDVAIPDAGAARSSRTRNFPTTAEALGIRGIRIEDPAEVEDGIAAALAHDGPVLVDAVVNRTELGMREPGFDHGGSSCIRGAAVPPSACGEVV